MTKEKIVDIIKGALLLEYRGKSFYESVVRTTKVDAVKEFFDFLVGEEKKHIDLLERQFKNVAVNMVVDLKDVELGDSQSSNKILSDKIVNEVLGAGYESAFIAAALEFEKNAVNYYSEHAATAESVEEKKLYKWLADWEKSHMTMLAELDKEIKEKIWYDNSFWPL